MPPILLLITGAVPLVLLAKHWWTKSAPLPGLPYNKSPNPLGDIIGLFTTPPVDYFSQHVLKHGKISQVLLGPLGRLILVADAKEIEENLLKQAQNFDKAGFVRAAFFCALPEGTVSLPTNEQWKLHRRMMAPSMSPAFLATRMNRISANVQKLLDIWALKSNFSLQSNGVFECDDDLERFSMDNILEVLFGENMHCLGSTYDYLLGLDVSASHTTGGVFKIDAPTPQTYQSLRYFLKGMGKALASGSAQLVYFRLNLTPSWRSARRGSYRFVAAKLGEHQEHGNAGPQDSYLDRLSARYPGGRPKDVSPTGFQDEILTYIVGGADSTATVICWMLRYLTLHPQVQIRLHDDLSAAFQMTDKFSVSIEDLQGPRFPYLDAVIHETLRLSNVSGISPRDALRDVAIAGVHIPRGSKVLFLTGHSAIHDAPPVEGKNDIASSTFYPERWLVKDPSGADAFDLNSVASWPFGYGPRGCPGQRLAFLELKALLLAFSLTFYLEETQETKTSHVEMSLNLRKPSGVGIKVRKWSGPKLELQKV
ncbi:cytochrome P450 [Mycena maculata]|uniref:Cytochrome P450 n=1 Tax=Mycena maculata TaxID=230809 RepID=A0AAD7HIU0_9AGAR|nr:cytochrome P450 [Mycena maculata]